MNEFQRGEGEVQRKQLRTGGSNESDHDPKPRPYSQNYRKPLKDESKEAIVLFFFKPLY
jgi:hypothetical protein